MIEIGIDSFAAKRSAYRQDEVGNQKVMQDLLERIRVADVSGLHIFGVGEHHRAEFLDAATTVILGAAATLTQNIRLSSAVTVLSAADPVRVFQQFATLDLISGGRAEMVVGRGSFIEAFPLFGYQLEDYNELFAEKLELLLNIQAQTRVQWKGKFRPEIPNLEIHPRPLQNPLPIWLGVGGTPESFIRAGVLGMPLMVAIIGGETHRFRPLIDLYRRAGKEAGHPPEKLKVGLHALGYVGESTQKAQDEFYPGYAEMFTQIGKERGYPPVTRAAFDSQVGEKGAFVVGSAMECAEKILRHSEALGGIDRFTFQMDVAGLDNQKLLASIERIGADVIPALTR